MYYTTCPRCLEKFYVTLTEKEFDCPFCNYTIRHSELVRRESRRDNMQRECEILRKGINLSAQTVNISKGGSCIVMRGAIQFEEEETIHIIIKDLDIKSDASVVWVKRFDNIVSRVGLRFC